VDSVDFLYAIEWTDGTIEKRLNLEEAVDHLGFFGPKATAQQADQVKQVISGLLDGEELQAKDADGECVTIRCSAFDIGPHWES